MKDNFLEIIIEEDIDEISFELECETNEFELEIEYEGELIASGGSVSYDVYAGEYIITPDTDADTLLDTEDKLMKADLTVKKMPYAEVSNISGGTTVTIGE